MTSTARPVVDFGWKTLTGKDYEESNREINEKLKGVKPFANDAEFFAYAHAQWDARQNAAQATDNE